MIMNKDYLEELLSGESGHVMEIGAGEGFNTRVFCELSSAQRVIVVDPFESCWDDDDIDESYIKPYPSEQWMRNVAQYEEKLLLVKKRSDDETVFDDLKDFGQIIFCFVDGIQKEENIVSDLSLLDKLNVKYICLDDWSRESAVSQVKAGTMKFLDTNDNYEILDIRGHNVGTGSIRDLCFLKRK